MFGFKSQKSYEYPDDIFDSSRMSFGDHLDELRTRLLRAVKGLLVCMFLGFILDGIGTAVGSPYIGIGKPMIDIITDPVETQVRDFYFRRAEKERVGRLEGLTATDEDEIQRIRKKLEANDNSLNSLSYDERLKLMGSPQEMPVSIPVSAFTQVFGDPKPGAPSEISFRMKVYPAYLSTLSNTGETISGTKKYLATLSAQEGFVVYFKVSVICGLVLASPVILYQFWAFVGAGLYPHEKRYVGFMVWPSVFLFVGGVLLCQFLVLPNAVKALLKINEWLGFDPDIRLNEWLGLALILPLVFGISFQTPLVMIALNRLGMFTAADYLARWRGACFGMAVFAAVITPTPDPVTMLYLFAPMFGLYLFGVGVCHYFPGSLSVPMEEEAADEVAV